MNDNNTSSWFSKIKLQEGDDDSEDEEHLNNGNVSRGGNLRDDDDDVSDPVNVSCNLFLHSLLFSFLMSFNGDYFPQERLTLAEKNERLQSQLRSLKEDLAHTRDDQVRQD